MYFVEIPTFEKISYMELVVYMLSRVVDIFVVPVVEITSMPIPGVFANKYTHQSCRPFCVSLWSKFNKCRCVASGHFFVSCSHIWQCTYTYAHQCWRTFCASYDENSIHGYAWSLEPGKSYCT